VIRRLGAGALCIGLLIGGIALAGRDGGPSAALRWKDTAIKACDERWNAVNVASAGLTAQSTADQFAEWFRRFFEPAYRHQLDSMRAAGPPDDTARALVADTVSVLDAMAASPESFAVAQDPFSDVDARWDAYGLSACGTRSG